MSKNTAEEELYSQLSQAVVSMKADEVRALSLKVLELGLLPEIAIDKGLAEGMNRVGKLFAEKVYFVPEVLVCAKAMSAGFEILKPKVLEGKLADKGTIVIGVVEGDFHDIGKNIVKLMLEAGGFRMVDVGKNASYDKFAQTISTEKPLIVALSTLMTTTMDSMAEIVSKLRERNSSLKFMVGGAPVNQDFADKIGAHFYGKDAYEAVQGARQLTLKNA
jgi:corrinoid protein of di/trimethylamine methyltransferase